VRYGFVIDQRRCIGCHACTVACKEENRVPLGAFRTWVKYIERGTFPHTRRYFSVLRCNHCDAAPCVTICPTVALYRRADGIVDFDGERCIGCKSCMQACPYDALYIDPDTGTAAKCNYCAHRVEVGLEPACVIVCPAQAIIAGDLDDPTSPIATIVAREAVQVRKAEQGTRPKVFYLGADAAALLAEAPGSGEARIVGGETRQAERRVGLERGGEVGLLDGGPERHVAHGLVRVGGRVRLPDLDARLHQLAHRRLEVVVADDPARDPRGARARLGLLEHDHVLARALAAQAQLLRQVVRRREPVDSGPEDDVR